MLRCWEIDSLLIFSVLLRVIRVSFSSKISLFVIMTWANEERKIINPWVISRENKISGFNNKENKKIKWQGIECDTRGHLRIVYILINRIVAHKQHDNYSLYGIN